MPRSRKKLSVHYNREVGKSLEVSDIKYVKMPEKEEIESIYRKTDDFKDKVHEDLSIKAVRKGKFATLDEAKAAIPKPYVCSTVKNICCGRSVAKNDYEEKISSMNYIIREIMGVTPIQFYTHYSVENLKKYGLYQVVNFIAENAPDDIKIECMFDTKMIFFKVMYPEIFGEKLNNLTGHDIFFCNDNVKSGLCRAGNVEKAFSSKKGEVYGKEVDEILMDAICDVIYDDLDLNSQKEIFQFLAQESYIYCDKTGNKPAGINDVVKKRGYSSLIDFYYLNLDKDQQVKYAKDFIKVRDTVAEKIPENRLLTNTVRKLVAKNLMIAIYNSDDMDKRKELCDELKDLLYVAINNKDKLTYKNGYVMDTYVNFDSNSGLTVVRAYASPEQIYENSKKKDFEYIKNCLSDIICNIDDRNEIWTDEINEEIYMIETPSLSGISTVLKDLFECLEPDEGMDEFKEDMQAIIEERELDPEVAI